MDELRDVLDAVGPKLRTLRKQRDITLADLSRATGISQSTLSRPCLLYTDRAYGVPLDELVGAPATGDPRVHLRPVKRFGMTFVPLSKRPGGIQAFKLVIPPRPKSYTPELQTHEGYEWLYVLDGRLRLMLSDHYHVFKAGEVAEFDTHTPHSLMPDDDRPVELLILFGPQGERVHLGGSAESRREY